MPKIATDGVLQLWRLDLSWLLRWSDVVPSIFGLFKWQFEPEVILLRLVFALLAFVPRRSFWPNGACTPDHVTAWRWVQRYAPEMERRLRRQLKPTNDSWRVDETYIRVKVKWVYLYRAVDSTGATIPSFGQARHRGRVFGVLPSFERCRAMPGS